MTSSLMPDVGLSNTEQRIFAQLASRPNALVTREELLSAMRGKAPHTIDSHIMGIRRKLESHRSSASIETVKGSGFILRLGPPAR